MRERWALKGGGLWDPTSIEEENETLFMRVRKLLPNRHVLKHFFTSVWKHFPSKPVLKTLRRSLKKKAKEVILASDGFGP